MLFERSWIIDLDQDQTKGIHAETLIDLRKVQKILAGRLQVPWDVFSQIRKFSKHEKCIEEHYKYCCSFTDLFFQEKVRESCITLDDIRLERKVIFCHKIGKPC